MANIQKGDTVLVIGSGMAGILHIQLAKQKRCKQGFASDISPDRLELAAKFGATQVLDAKVTMPTLLKHVNGGRGADKVIVCTGAIPKRR